MNTVEILRSLGFKSAKANPNSYKRNASPI